MIGHGKTLLDQADMALMQGTHSWHEPKGLLTNLRSPLV